MTKVRDQGPQGSARAQPCHTQTTVSSTLDSNDSSIYRSVVQTFNSSIHQINSYPEDRCYGIRLVAHWIEIYPVDSLIHVSKNGVLSFGTFMLCKTTRKTNANSADPNLWRPKIQRHTLLQYLPTSTIPNKAFVTPGVISNSPFDLHLHMLVNWKQNLAIN